MCANQRDGRVSPFVVVPLTSCRDDSVVCCRSAVPLRPSCGEHRTETIVLSASFCRTTTAVVRQTSYGDDCVVCVVLPYRYGRRAANIARRRLCCLRRSAVPLRPSCGEHRTETIVLSASFCRTTTAVVRRTSYGDDCVVCVVLPYHYGRRAANIARTRLCCLRRSSIRLRPLRLDLN